MGGRANSAKSPPWHTCEAVLSEIFHLIGEPGAPALRALLRRGALLVAFDFAGQMEPILKLKVMIPELLEENGVPEDACHQAPVTLLYHEEQDLILNR